MGKDTNVKAPPAEIKVYAPGQGKPRQKTGQKPPKKG